MKRIIICLVLCIPLSLFSISEAVDNTTLYNKALGGPHSAMVKGFDTFFNNPALLSEYEYEISFMELGLNMKGDALDLLNLYLGGELNTDDTAGLLDTLQERGLTSLLVGIDLAGPLTVGKIGNNWGWCIKNSTNVYISLPGLVSTADVIAREDLMFSVGIAIPFKMKFGDSFFVKVTPGVMSRTTLRGEVHIESDLIGIMGYADDFGSILDTYPLYISPMFAIDAGFLINIYDVVNIAGVVKDIYTPILKYPVTTVEDALDIFTSSDDTTGNLVYREINFGLSVDIPLGPLSLIISDLDIYIDYFDVLEVEKNVLLHFGAGVDIELLEKFHLLAGMNEGLLALGLNVDIGGFDIGFVMYGTEEGTQPGINSTFNFLISMGISF